MTDTYKIDPSAVSILVDEDIHKPLGTGFYFLRPHYFITAKHVVEYEGTGDVRRNLVLTQDAPSYPKARVIFRHPDVDLAVLWVDCPGCNTPLYPSDQRLSGIQGLQYWGYSPKQSDPSSGRYAVAVAGPARYVDDPPRERDRGVERLLRFEGLHYEPGHSGGPVLGNGGGVVAVIVAGDSISNEGWFLATEINSLLPYMTFQFPDEPLRNFTLNPRYTMIAQNADASVDAVFADDAEMYIAERIPIAQHPWEWVLRIKRMDRQPIRSWRVLQDIKNAVAGPERDAIEVYPPESKVTDLVNVYHLWVFEEGYGPNVDVLPPGAAAR